MLFTTVEREGFTAVTGIRFASTGDRRIVSQWSYLNADSGAGELDKRLEVATATASGAVTAAQLSSTALAAFGLDGARAARLVETHCRFRKEP